MKSNFATFVFLMVPTAMIGCGGEATVEQPEPTPVSYDFVKAVLEEGIKSGDIGSAAMEVDEGLQVMVDGGDAKAGEILSEFNEVVKSQGTSAFRKKAQSLIDKL